MARTTAARSASGLTTQRRRQNGTLITGDSLTIPAVATLADKGAIAVAPEALERTRRTQQIVLGQATKRPIYGVNTGFGPMVRHIISGKKLQELQYNLLRSHATGLGTPIPQRFVRAAMLVRINTLAHGNSGVSPELIEQFRMLFNAGVTPIIPEHGAVGTSGDLVQLAHIALSIIGEGEVMYRGKRLPAAAVLRTLGIKPHTLAPKEGLSLINGTSVMTGIGALLAHSARALFDLELRIGACELELVHGFTDILDPVLHALRPHAQQMEVAARLRELLADSGLMMDRERATEDIAIESRTKEAPKLLQEVYSLRCIPQIMGPMYAALEHAESTITTEMNSVTDNPIVDPERELCLHGGNFHGDFVATAIDHLKIALVKLSLLSERRINFFLNKNVNQGLPAFLNLVEPGQTLALQGLQFVATSTAAHNQSLAYPHSLHTISTNGDNQDIVSMGTDAALITNRVLENAYTIAAIELVTISQAAEIRKADFAKASRSSRELIAFVRSFVKPVYEDRILSAEVERLKQALIEGNF